MKKAHVLIATAWLFHVVAWFLPVINGGVSLPKGLPGWEAFRFAFCTIWPYQVHYNNLYIDMSFDNWYAAVLATVSAVLTVSFILGSPWVVSRGSSQLRRVSAWAAAAAFIINAHWYVLSGADRSDLRIGYFLWWSSFLLLAIGLFALARRDKVETAPVDANSVEYGEPRSNVVP